MKRFGQFLLILGCFIVIAYAEPVLFPTYDKTPPVPKTEKPDVTVAHTSSPYSELAASGLAHYVGKSTDEFTKDYGEPLEIQETALGYEWWILGEDERDYLQVAVKNDKIASIFTLGDELITEPFKLGMTLTDISEITTIYSNFDFTKKEVKYRIELSEEDMNYRPLVAFDNESFAILHLNQETGKLIGIRYLNKATLLRLMPYQLNDGELTEKVIDDATDWEVVNQDSQRQLQSILDILRKRAKLPAYTYAHPLTEATEKGLSQFMAEPTKILTDKARLAKWLEHENSYEFNKPFKLSAAEFTHIVTSIGIEPKDTHGILYAPGYDVPFLVMTWFSEVLTRRQFTHKEDKEVGIAFYKDVVLFLFSEKELVTEESVKKLQLNDLLNNEKTMTTTNSEEQAE